MEGKAPLSCSLVPRRVLALLCGLLLSGSPGLPESKALRLDGLLLGVNNPSRAVSLRLDMGRQSVPSDGRAGGTECTAWV